MRDHNASILYTLHGKYPLVHSIIVLVNMSGGVPRRPNRHEPYPGPALPSIYPHRNLAVVESRQERVKTDAVARELRERMAILEQMLADRRNDSIEDIRSLRIEVERARAQALAAEREVAETKGRLETSTRNLEFTRGELDRVRHESAATIKEIRAELYTTIQQSTAIVAETRAELEATIQENKALKEQIEELETQSAKLFESQRESVVQLALCEARRELENQAQLAALVPRNEADTFLNNENAGDEIEGAPTVGAAAAVLPRSTSLAHELLESDGDSDNDSDSVVTDTRSVSSSRLGEEI